MENIWSKNKYVNTTINILLFLMASNFLHYGYLLLPLICLILFIDNKYQFKTNNIKMFILLSMFALSFYVFSYKLGLYSFIGFFLPMVYYIGSNIKDINEEKVKRIIYILTFGMATHVLLNFGYELIIRGIEIFTRNSHLDFWTKEEHPTTQTSVNIIFIISLIYYTFVYETNRRIVKKYAVLLLLCMIYEIALARRTTLFVLIISIIISIFFDKVINKNSIMKFKKVIIAIVIITVLGLLYYLFLYNPWSHRQSLQIFNKFFFTGIKTGRLDIFIRAIKIAPKHLWGGQEISTLFDINVHDLWMDTFDYAGIIPYILLIVYSIYCLINMIYTFRNNGLSKSFRLLAFVLFVCITIQMFLEPIITGSPIFLLCSILVFASIECLNSK